MFAQVVMAIGAAWLNIASLSFPLVSTFHMGKATDVCRSVVPA